MLPWQRWISRFQARVLWGEFLHLAADGLAAFLFLFGTLVLVVRLAVPSLWPQVLWIAAAAVPLTIGAWIWAKRRQQSERETVAMLDKALSAGGLLMTLSERPQDDWSQELPQLERLWRRALPVFYPKRFLSHVTLPILFVVATCFIPLREARSTPLVSQDVAQQTTKQLEELQAALKEEQLLSEEEEKQLQEEIAKLTEESKGTPLSHEDWETVDALREKIEQKIEQAAAQANKEQSAVKQLAEALGEQGDAGLTQQEQAALEEQAEEAIENMIKKAEKEDQQAQEEGQDGEKNNESGSEGGQAGKQKMSNSLKEKLRRLNKGKGTKGGKPKLPTDPQERQELLDELREEIEKQKEELEKIRSKCKKCRGTGDGEGECESNGFNEEAGPDQDGRPGKGGISRGRGDAEMKYGDESDDSQNKFKDVILPPSELGEPGEEIVDIQFTAPEVKPAASAAKGAARQVDTATGSQTWQRKLSPKHRAVVKQYFDGQ